MEDVARLFLDEDYGRGRPRIERVEEKEENVETPSGTRNRTNQPRKGLAHADAASPNTFKGFLTSLWDALLAEDGDEWADERRGRGGTPSGARAMANVERGVEQEMEVVLRADAIVSPMSGRGECETPSPLGRTMSGGSSGTSWARRGRKSGGYFFGEEDEDALVMNQVENNSDNEIESSVLPNVYPGKPAELAGEGKVDARAAEMQRLWGTAEAFKSADECRQVLRSLEEAGVILDAMDERLARWVVKTKVRAEDGEFLGADDLLEFWRRRATDLCEALLQALLRAGGRFESCSTTPKHRESLVVTVEGYVMGTIQRKILDEGICPTFRDEEALVARRFEELAPLSIDALGLDTARYGNVVSDNELIDSIATMSGLSCPAHVAIRMASVTSRALRLGGSDDEPMSADDLLLVLVALIARAKTPQILSLVKYVETFHALLSNAHKGEQGFALTHFVAAVHFAKSEEASRLSC